MLGQGAIGLPTLHAVIEGWIDERRTRPERVAELT